MTQHPAIHASTPKEVHYFDGGRVPGRDMWSRGEAWYRAHFPTRRRVGSGITIEASPLYLFHPLAPTRIASALPDARVVILLRNPVDRAVSHYFHQRTRGREPLTLLAALQAEDERLGVLPDGSFSLDGDAWIQASYVRRGLYADQLRRWKEAITPDRLMVIASERLFEAPAETLHAVFEFCGVDPSIAPDDLSPRMVGRRKNVDPAATDWLDARFEEPNRELFELLGERYDW